MFELGGLSVASPGFLALLLLAAPWILAARRRQPLAWTVGDLAPFRQLDAVAGPRRGWPPSLLIGLAALLCGSLAAAGLRRPAREPIWIVDGSFSFAAHPAAAAAPWRAPASAEAVVVGTLEEPLPARALLAAIRLHGSGRRVIVLTDRSAPPATPAQIHWRRLPRSARNAAILELWTEADHARLRWAAWGITESLALRRGGRLLPLDTTGGAEGQIHLDALQPGERLELVDGAGAALADDQPQDDVWLVAEPARFVLPDSADPRWEDALAAAWPGCVVGRGGAAGTAAGALAVRLDGGAAALSFAGDPFARATELEAVAEIARRLAPAWKSYHRARPWSECAPASPTPAWEDRLPAAVAWRDASRPLAWVGLILFGLALALRRGGR